MRHLNLLGGREIPPFGWLAAAAVGFGLAFSIFITVSTNFMVEELGIRPSELGLLETIREVPGLLTIVMGAALMTVAEPVVGAVALLLLCIGYINFFHVTTIEVLIVFSLTQSIGFHLWWPVANTIALRLSTVETQGRRLGQLRSLMAGANLVGILVVLVAVTVLATGIRPLFLLAGGVAALCGAGGVAAALDGQDWSSATHRLAASLLAVLRADVPGRRAPAHFHDVRDLSAGGQLRGAGAHDHDPGAD